LFSVVIPLFNKVNQIIDALNSIRVQEEQYFEVIVVDDGSTDQGHEIVLDWISKLPQSEANKYHIFKKNNGGVSSARNYGINKASNEFVAFLDADDLWKENHLKNLRKLIQDFGLQVDVFSNASCQMIDSKMIFPKLGKYYGYRGVCSFPKVNLISNGFLNSSSVCIRRDLISENKFPEGWTNLEDVITWVKTTTPKGFAFDYRRTSIYRTDFSESSKDIKFDNYILFEREFSKLNYSPLLKFTFLMRFMIIHFMYAKLVDNQSFFEQAKKIIGKAPITTFCYLLVAMIPGVWLKKLKDFRKSKE
jgi:glycosyltransferase involved in cell wall biosynthesis